MVLLHLLQEDFQIRMGCHWLTKICVLDSLNLCNLFSVIDCLFFICSRGVIALITGMVIFTVSEVTEMDICCLFFFLISQ